MKRRKPLSLRLLLPALLTLATGCAPEKSGLPYDTLRISVTRSGAASVAGFPRCVTLPVLNGSVIEERHSIEAGLAVEIVATNELIDLSFPGATQTPSPNRSIPVERLRSSYSESFEIANASGTTFTIGLGSACSQSDAR